MVAEHDILPLLEKHRRHFHFIVPSGKGNDSIAPLDLSKNNLSFTDEIFNDTDIFSNYINQKRKDEKATYLVGGYKEIRNMYRRSKLFDEKEEPRSLHLGIDIS